MPRIWISKNNPAAVTESLRSATSKVAFPGKAILSAFVGSLSLIITGALLLSGCASSSAVSQKAPLTAPAVVSRTVPTHVVATRETPDLTFMGSNVASEASEFIRLGRESMADSAWFEASEYLDSAMTHLAVLETFPSLTLRQKLAVEVSQDSVREWLVEAVSQSARLGEAEDLSEYLDQEIEEVSFASLEELEALLPRLPNRNYGIPVPSPLPHSVLQAMKVFTGSGRGYFEKWLQRKNRYDALITGKLEERGMPRDLIYLAMVESGFNPKAWSHASASGLWQFISPTGRRYGLQDDWWEDARRDPVRATDAALDYLEDLNSEFGNWHQTMAAYNCGEGRIRRQLRADPQLSYWEMSLPSETRFYVPKILAAMIIGNNAASFGFRTEEKAAAPLRYDTATVTRSLPLRGIADAVGIDEDSLKSLNPSLRRWCTPPGRQRYTIYLPAGTRELFYVNHQSIDPETRTATQRHVVTSGQTLSGISRKYGVTMASIQRANGLKGTKLRKGQALLIPGSGEDITIAPGPAHSTSPAPTVASEPVSRTVSASHVVRRGETLSGLAVRYHVSMAALKASNVIKGQLRIGQALVIPAAGDALTELRVETVASASPKVPTVHRVRRGETLAGIARLFRVSVSALRNANGMSPRSVLQAGQVLSIPATVRDASDDEEVRAPTRARKVYTVRNGDNLSELAERFGVSQAELQRWNGLRGYSLSVGQKLIYHPVAPAYGEIRLASADASSEFYRVKNGDNLWDISSRFGQSVEDVKRLNGGLSEALHPGQRIRVR